MLKGNLVLLTFLNFAEEADKEAGSRSQLVFLKSMQRQYGIRGLKIIIMDVKRVSKNSFNVFYYNFEKDNPEGFDLVSAKNTRRLAKKIGVDNAPATLLISTDGRIVKQWNKLALPAQLAFAIEKELK